MPTDRISQSPEEVEATEKRATEKRPPSPPHDQPGAPGYPSRAESHARATEAGRQSVLTDENDAGAKGVPEKSSSDQISPATRRKPLSPARSELGESSVKETEDAGDNEPDSGALPTKDQATGASESKGTGGGTDSYRQRLLGEELADSAEKKVDKKIDQTLDRVNPKYDATKSDYSENCTGVVQANELRRRGMDVEAGPLESHLRTDQGGSGGRPLDVIEHPWNRKFTDGTKTEIEAAFQDPGARGVVYIRLDDLQTPGPNATKPYLER